MARIIGLAGEPNTGKSYSRIFLKNPEKAFVLMPSRKAHYLKGASPFEIKNGKPTGNFMVKNTPDLTEISKTIRKIATQYTEIEYLILPDFTHYISNILSNRAFISRKAGGEAYQRFWELAGDLLNTFFNKIAKLREDLTIIIEFHTEYDEYTNKFHIFVPGGKMLTEKFKLDSYFDILLYTYAKEGDDIAEEDKYKFIVKSTSIDGVKYPARSMNIFAKIAENGIFIPNNLQLVLDTIKENKHLF